MQLVGLPMHFLVPDTVVVVVLAVVVLAVLDHPAHAPRRFAKPLLGP